MNQHNPLHYRIATWMYKNFPKLKDNQALTTIFDSFLVVNSFLFHNRIYTDSRCLTKVLKKYEGVTTQKNKFCGIQFDILDKEICHIHGNGIVDILCAELIPKKYLVENGYFDLHHAQPKSKWTTLYLDGTTWKAHQNMPIYITK